MDDSGVSATQRRGLKIVGDVAAFKREVREAIDLDKASLKAFRQWERLPAAERRRYEDWTPKAYALHVRKLTASPRPRAREHRSTGSRRVSQPRARAPGRPDDDPPLHPVDPDPLAALQDANARIVRAVDAWADGDREFAFEILRDLELDLSRWAA